MTENSLKVLIGWKEIASYLSCSMSTAIRRVNDGLPVFRVGGSVRAFAADIDRWLEGERLRKLEERPEPEPPGIIVDDTNLMDAVSTYARDKKGRRFAVIPLGINTSEYERIEDRLKSAEEKYRWLLETVPVWIWETNADGEYSYSNVAVIDMLGYRPEELSGFKPVDFLISPEDVEKCGRATSNLQTNKEVIRDLQCRFVHRDGTVKWLETDAEPAFDGVGNFAGIRGVSRDITERKRAEEALLHAAKEWRRTFDAVADVVFLIDRDHEILRVNRAATQRFGKNFDGIIGESCYRLIHGRNKPAPDCSHICALASGDQERREFYEPTVEAFFEATVSPVRGNGGELVGSVHVLRDVTERTRAEEALRESRDFLDRILNGMYEGVTVIGRDYEIQAVNRCFAEQYGETREGLIGRYCHEVTHWNPKPCSDPEHPCPLESVFATGEPFRVEHVHKDREGKEVTVEIYAFPLFNGNGEVESVVEITNDVTERKKAEEALRESEEKYRNIFEHSPAGIVIHQKGKVLFVSPAMLKMIGYESADEVVERPLLDFVHPDYHEKLMKELDVVYARGSELGEPSEHVLIRKDGSFLNVSSVAQAILHDGEPAIQAYVLNNAEHKRAEEELRRRGEELAAINDLAVELAAAATTKEIFTLLCEKLKEMTGALGTVGLSYDPSSDELAISHIAADGDVVAAAQKVIGDNFHKLKFPRQPYSAEEKASERVFRSDGVPKPAHRVIPAPLARALEKTLGMGELYDLLLLRAGEIIGSVTALMPRGAPPLAVDTLEAFAHVAETALQSNLAEEASRESERRFRDIADNALEWIWEVDAKGKYTYASPVVEKILGYKPEEILKKRFYDFFHADDRRELKKAAFEVFAEKRPFREFVNRNVTKDGKTVYLSTSGVPILDEKGNLLGYRGADIDITERKRTEQKLIAAEAQLREVLAAVSDEISFVDADETIIFASREFAEMLGYEPDELKGKPLRDLVPPEKFGKIVEETKERRSGKSSTYEMAIRHRDGPVKNVTVYCKPLTNEAGEFLGTLGKVVDRN